MGRMFEFHFGFFGKEKGDQIQTEFNTEMH